MRAPSRLSLSVGGLALLVLLTSLLPACTTTVARRDPRGDHFPAVSGKDLDGTEVRLPEDLGGEPAILLVGYVMKAQFDLDRWLLGLVQLETPVRAVEVPTIRGMFPGMIAGRIDAGMRSGIPPEDWALRRHACTGKTHSAWSS